MDIEFDAVQHMYVVDGDIASRSVTEVLAKHGLAPDYSSVDQETLSVSAKKGTAIHRDLEYVLNQEGYEAVTIEGGQFQEWAKQNLKSGHGEQPVAIKYKDLVIGGTVDFIGEMVDGSLIIGDHKTTSTIHTQYVRWQLSIYDYALRHLSGSTINGKKIEWAGATKFYCMHYHNDKFKVKEIEPISDEEIEKLLEAEASGTMYAPLGLVADANFLKQLEDAEDMLLGLKEKVKKWEQVVADAEATLISLFEEQGIKSWETEKIKVTYVAPQQRVSFDTARFKAEKPKVYEKYVKTTNCKAYVKITKKGAKKK